MRRIALPVLISLTVPVLAACGSAADVAGAAQQAVQQGSAVVSAATDIAAACTTAAAAWAPGVSAAEARTALDEALGIVDDTVSATAGVPGAAAVQDVLRSARESLAADPGSTSLGVSRGTLEAACSVFLLAN